jgi:hypothetical protein
VEKDRAQIRCECMESLSAMAIEASLTTGSMKAIVRRCASGRAIDSTSTEAGIAHGMLITNGSRKQYGKLPQSAIASHGQHPCASQPGAVCTRSLSVKPPMPIHSLSWRRDCSELSHIRDCSCSVDGPYRASSVPRRVLVLLVGPLSLVGP